MSSDAVTCVSSPAGRRPGDRHVTRRFLGHGRGAVQRGTSSSAEGGACASVPRPPHRLTGDPAQVRRPEAEAKAPAEARRPRPPLPRGRRPPRPSASSQPQLPRGLLTHVPMSLPLWPPLGTLVIGSRARLQSLRSMTTAKPLYQTGHSRGSGGRRWAAAAVIRPATFFLESTPVPSLP